MTSQPDAVLICVSTDSTGQMVPGTKAMLANCGHEVFVAPSGLAHIADVTLKGETIEVNCVGCGVGRAIGLGHIEPIALSGQLDEMREHLSPTDFERVQAIFKAWHG